jgi:hypothetical protein
MVYALESATRTPLAGTQVPLNKDDLVPVRHEQRYDQGFRWVARRLSVEAEHYLPVNVEEGVNAAGDEWSILSVFISGADSTTQQSAEIQTVVNLELIPSAATIAAQTATPAANDNGLLRSSVHQASAKMSSFFR